MSFQAIRHDPTINNDESVEIYLSIETKKNCELEILQVNNQKVNNNNNNMLYLTMELFSETVYSPIQRCKIYDFGTAKYLLPNNISVSYICSRYYQAP
ncbi:unnamed protein product [Rotaria sordida]|uniref:Protein kinase domain-containing protein n=1 Tax=Rotaria sordida TaxID=392033 RepID=A0A814MT13_9BILA|nr:unnamed protein product [Rotaria sordida]CAF1082456.1 unnamed protein product [Rotaria sordida]